MSAATYKSASGAQLPAASVLTREEARRRGANAANASESYAGWLKDCRRLLEDEAQTDDQKRIARGFCHIAETRMRFEQQLADMYSRLARGESFT